MSAARSALRSWGCDLSGGQYCNRGFEPVSVVLDCQGQMIGKSGALTRMRHFFDAYFV